MADFRRAVKQALALTDKRGFDYFAGWHGVPLGWCQHHDPLFLPWHRAYLYWLEHRRDHCSYRRDLSGPAGRVTFGLADPG